MSKESYQKKETSQNRSRPTYHIWTGPSGSSLRLEAICTRSEKATMETAFDIYDEVLRTTDVCDAVD